MDSIVTFSYCGLIKFYISTNRIPTVHRNIPTQFLRDISSPKIKRPSIAITIVLIAFHKALVIPIPLKDIALKNKIG